MYGNPIPNHQILAIVILGSTAKFNSCQYFQLYGTSCIADLFPWSGCWDWGGGWGDVNVVHTLTRSLKEEKLMRGRAASPRSLIKIIVPLVTVMSLQVNLLSKIDASGWHF